MILHDSPQRDERCYISTSSGKQLRLRGPEASQIDIEDIAHGLAYQCCFNGQTRFFYSLAQHSLLVANLVPPQHRLAALLHDAVAAYFGDMARPMRQLLADFSLIEKEIMAAVSEKFSVFGFDAPVIKRAHQIAQATEQRDLCHQAIEPCAARNRSTPIPRRIEFMSPEEALYQFMELFTELVRKTSPGQQIPAVCREPERRFPENHRSAACRLLQPKTSEVPAMGRKNRHRQALPAIGEHA